MHNISLAFYKYLHHKYGSCDDIMEKMEKLLPSDESRVIHPSTRKVVFLTYKFSLSSSSINNPGLVMLVFLHCLVRSKNRRHRAQETFLCLLPKPQQQMLSVCFHNLKYIHFWFSFFPSWIQWNSNMAQNILLPILPVDKNLCPILYPDLFVVSL